MLRKCNYLNWLILIFVSCSELTEIQLLPSDNIPDQESWEAIIILTNKGKMRAKIKSGHLEKYNEKSYILLDTNVTVDFFDQDERHTSILTSDAAEIDQKSNNMKASGNVVAISDSGITLFSEILFWDSKKEKLYTETNIMITTLENDTLFGTGFESNSNLKNWKILNPFRGVRSCLLREKKNILSVKGLGRRYGKRMVVKDIDLYVKRGEVVGLLGPNGAGKTTTFYMITGMITPTIGDVFLDEENITKCAMYKRARKGIGYLAQEASIFGKLSVKDNLKLVLQMRRNFSKIKQEKKLKSLLDELSITHLINNKGSTLSGGERRRVEIARTLSMDPDFILLDEPFAGVDPIAVEEIQDIVFSLKRKNIGVLITDHNVRETLSITDRSYLLYDGRILKSGDSLFLANDDEAKRLYLGENFSLS